MLVFQSATMSTFISYAFKTQHPCKQEVNADMSANAPYYLTVFDGVGGVKNIGLKPEDLSWDLRERTRHLLDKRSAKHTDRSKFDKEMLSAIGIPRGSKTAKGQWLHDLVVYAALQTTCLGSSTMALASLMHGKMAYYCLGDCFIHIYRPLPLVEGLQILFETRVTASTVRTIDGSETRIPKQFAVYRDEERELAARQLLSQGDFGVVEVLKGDIIAMGSDGISDNLSTGAMKKIISERYFSGDCPKVIAEVIAGDALRAGLKPDDTTIIVAFVC